MIWYKKNQCLFYQGKVWNSEFSVVQIQRKYCHVEKTTGPVPGVGRSNDVIR